jgi:hypothetical protein
MPGTHRVIQKDKKLTLQMLLAAAEESWGWSVFYSPFKSFSSKYMSLGTSVFI